MMNHSLEMSGSEREKGKGKSNKKIPMQKTHHVGMH